MPVFMIVSSYILLGVLFVVSLLQAAVPRWCWKMFESWKATAEPSEMYFLLRRILGIAGVIIVILVVTVPPILYYMHS